MPDLKPKYDFTKLRYDLSTVPEGKLVIEVFPELAEYEEFAAEWDDSMLRIVILSVDDGSPFVKLYRDDYERRISKIFDFLNLKNPELKQQILSGKSSVYNKMVSKFLMILDNLAYINYHSLLTHFHFMNAFLRQPPDFSSENMDRRVKVEHALPATHKRLIEMEQEFFPDAHTRKIVKKQIAKIIQFPERFAQEKQVV